YKCFGCGVGGDAIRFVMEIEGKSFPEALRKLAELYGVALPQVSARPGSDTERGHEKDEAYAALRVATERYERHLWSEPTGEAGRAYLAQRGIDCEIARTFRLGYAPAPSEAGWDTLCRALQGAGISLAMAQRLGLCGRSERTQNPYDKFRGRL